MDSLAAAIRPAPRVSGGQIFTPAMVQAAMQAMPAAHAPTAMARHGQPGPGTSSTRLLAYNVRKRNKPIISSVRCVT